MCNFLMAEYDCNMQEKKTSLRKEGMLIGGMVKFISITTCMKKK